ncbi:MAG: Hsp20/alpha crystallin family protein [Planctomycetes bacterium]|nr:Hsp20/alpha crystallin family protein [Planctomycetota bacterium]
MQKLDSALHQIHELYQKVTGQPAPPVPPDSFVPFPPGVDPVQHCMNEVEYLRDLSARLEFAPRPTAWIPTADCLATEAAFVVRVELPGVSREDLSVVMNGGQCIVRGERKPPAGELRPISVERPWGLFERRFAVPNGSDTNEVEARYVDGVLELRFATTPIEQQSKSIRID